MTPAIRRAIPYVALIVMLAMLVLPVFSHVWWSYPLLAFAGAAACFTARPSYGLAPEWRPRIGMLLLGVGLAELWHRLPWWTT